MRKPMSKMLIFVSIFFILVFGWYGVRKGLFWWYFSHYEPPAATVTTTNALAKTWKSYLTAVGTLTAINGVEIAAEVPGIVEDIRFHSGQFVKKDDVIIVLRTQLEQANLKSAQAKLQLAKINYDREKILFSKKASSHAMLDTRLAELLESQASVEAAQATIKQKTITAPFDGKIGIRQINIGQFLSPGMTMVTLQSLNPLYVSFTLPEQNLAQLKLGQDIDVSVNFGSGKTVQGKITAINAKVDQNTRNIQIQATIPNEQFELYPGMYGLVKIWLPEQKNIIVIPQTAVSYSLSGDYVFLIQQQKNEKNEINLHAYRQYIQVGERRGNKVSVLSGLKSGDKLVTTGQLKLQNGSKIVIDNTAENNAGNKIAAQ